MKKLYIGLCALSLLNINCGQNISSSELRETDAANLELEVLVTEVEYKNQAEISAILKTIPDEVGVKFNEGETLKASTQLDDGEYNVSANLSYDDNFLDLGEQYVANITKASVGQNYQITYKDRDGNITQSNFDSQGVPSLITPQNETTINLLNTYTLTWNAQELGNLKVRLYYDVVGGGSGFRSYTTGDDGSHQLAFNEDDLNLIAAGDATIELVHYTTHDSFDDWGKTDVRIQSISRRAVHFTKGQNQALLMAKQKLSPEDMLNLCSRTCEENENEIITLDEATINCCEHSISW